MISVEAKANDIAHHTSGEIENFEQAQIIFEEWLEEKKGWPSLFAIREIHKAVLKDIKSYKEKGAVPREPGEFRKEDLLPPNEAENFYVRGSDVYSTVRRFSEDLDSVLSNLPSDPKGNISTIVQNAAWAYYTFVRIHPFLDGNGRTGRFIMNRVLKGGGLESLRHISADQESTRDRHLDSMEGVDKTMDLAHLEFYLLEQLYLQTPDKLLRDEISNVYTSLQIITEAKNGPKRNLTDIWSGFSGLDIEGNIEEREVIAT